MRLALGFCHGALALVKFIVGSSQTDAHTLLGMLPAP